MKKLSFTTAKFVNIDVYSTTDTFELYLQGFVHKVSQHQKS